MMKIFIIGEIHDDDLMQKKELIKNIDYNKTVLLAEPYIYPIVKKEFDDIKNIILNGIEDYVIRLYVDIISIYSNLADNFPTLAADMIKSLNVQFNDLMMMHESHEYLAESSSYKNTYGENFFDAIKSLKEEFMQLLVGDNNPDINSLPEKNFALEHFKTDKTNLDKILIILRKISDIIENSKNFTPDQEKYIGEKFIAQLAYSTEKQKLLSEATLHFRDKVFSNNIAKYIKNQYLKDKDDLIIIVGTDHLPGLSKALNEKHLPVTIKYCFGYKDFNRLYRKHKDKLAKLDKRNEVESLKLQNEKLNETLNSSKKELTDFFKPKIKEFSKENENFKVTAEISADDVKKVNEIFPDCKMQ